MTETQLTEAMSEQAITWFARLRADDVSETDRSGFVGWLREDRNHQLAFVEIVNLWDGLAVIKSLDFDELRDFRYLWSHIGQSIAVQAVVADREQLLTY